MAGGQSRGIVADGSGDSLAVGSRFLIQVSCLGNRIKLFDNGVTQLSVLDGTFNSELNGFHTWRTIVEFKEREVEADPPASFVIMPFASEFDEVYLVIRETVEQHDFRCVRADQQFLSGTIIEGVFGQIEEANLIVADLTRKNANVVADGFVA
ncbi:MAG: hypothetical protein ACM35G_01115 [Planctomycetaceae bacterium]